MPPRDRPAPAVAHRLSVLAAGAPPAPAPRPPYPTHHAQVRPRLRTAADEPPLPGWTPRDPSPVPRPEPPGHAGAGGQEEQVTVRALAQAARRARPDRPAPPPDVGAPPRGRLRWAVAPRAAAVAALAVALLAGAVALRASTAPRGAPVEVPRPTASAAPADTAAPAVPTQAPAGRVVLHVVGAVGAPGLVTLPTDARVADAVTAAGGAAADADLGALNLARTVVDGEQIQVPRAGEAAPAPAPGTTHGAGAPAPVAGLLDLNSADAAALDALPGVGPVLAERILERRAQAPFTSVDELDEVSGIGPAVLERLRPLVRV